MLKIDGNSVYRCEDILSEQTQWAGAVIMRVGVLEGGGLIIIEKSDTSPSSGNCYIVTAGKAREMGLAILRMAALSDIDGDEA